MDVRFRNVRNVSAGKGRRPFKARLTRFALQSAILALAFGTAAHAESSDKSTVSKQEVQAKLTYCENCHGVSAQGFHGFYPIPDSRDSSRNT